MEELLNILLLVILLFLFLLLFVYMIWQVVNYINKQDLIEMMFMKTNDYDTELADKVITIYTKTEKIPTELIIWQDYYPWNYVIYKWKVFLILKEFKYVWYFYKNAMVEVDLYNF